MSESKHPNTDAATSVELWGARWLERLQASSDAYASRFRSSRALARPANVLELDLRPGHAHGRIVDKRGEVHMVDIAVRQLSAGEQEDVIVQIAQRADILAALLDGEMPPRFIEAVSNLEVDIFPSASELRPDCTCEQWEAPCVHAGALMIVLARSFDSDPFTLFELRGLPRAELLERVRAARSGGYESATSGQGDADTERNSRPWDGWEPGRGLSSPPVLADAHQDEERPDDSPWVQFNDPTGPVGSVSRDRDAMYEQASLLDVRTPSDAVSKIDAIVDNLRRDAAIRAANILSLGAPTMLEVGFLTDLSRLAAGSDSLRLQLETVLAGELSRADLDAMVDAWNTAGAEGVEVLTETSSWSTDQQALSDARDQLVAEGYERKMVSLSYNSLGVGRESLLVQHRTGQWYLLAEGGHRRPRRLLVGPLETPSELRGTGYSPAS